MGDRFTPSLAYTKSGTPVQVWSDSYWTLNQTRELLEKTFYSACYKYTCFSTDKTSGAANFSTPGWNGMLAENFGPTIDDIALRAVAEMEDSVFSPQNATQREALGRKMSELFNASMQKKFGNKEDIFCGSGNSTWIAKDKNPYDRFECTQVRIDIPRVYRYVPTNNEAASNPESQAKLNAERLRLAQALYGDAAGTWLGYQDTIQKCKDAGVPCNLYLGAIPRMN